MNYVRFVPEPNDQRTDPEWNWEGIKVGPNSQCQGNSNEDLLKAIAMEFDLQTLRKINTFNYYAMYFWYLKEHDPDVVERGEMMDFRNHAKFLNSIIAGNKIPLRVKIYSSIGDRPLKGMKPIERFDGSAEFLGDVLEKTNRVVSVGTLELPSGHWKRYHAWNDITMEFELNDPYGTPPYKTALEKKTVTVKQTYKQAEKSKLRRLIVLEDK